jgi:colanic acid/amylovoran biosynthesis glycosyltransferase
MNELRVIHSRPVWLAQTETWLFNQVKYLRADIEPHIICAATENLEQFGLAHIHRLGDASFAEKKYEALLQRLKIRNYRGKLFRAVTELRPHLFHSHFGDEAWMKMNLVKNIGIPHVVTFYGYDVNRLPKVEPVWLERYKELFSHVALVLCEGPHMARCIKELGCDPEKVRVHHLGIPVSEIPYRPRHWTPGTTLRVMISASFKEKKGIPDALEALGRLKNEILMEITIIGDASTEERSQREKRHIHEIVEKYQLGPQIHFMGYQPYRVLFEEAYKHHVFLSPSVTAEDGDTEGGAPVSIIEMAATGMPVVSTFHCDIPEVIQDGETGLLAEERNVSQLCEKILWLAGHPDSWTQMLDNGRKYIEAQFDAKIQGVTLGDIYDKLVHREKP